MRVSLNLATRPFADLGPALKSLRIGIGVLAVLAVGFGIGVHFFHSKAEAARASEHVVELKIAAIQRERLGYQEMMRKPENALLMQQAAALNKLFDEKSFSWTLAIEDLETVLPAGVQVSSLEPLRDGKTGKTTLHLRVIGPRDRAVELVRNLEHSKRFTLPRIVGESSETTGGPGERMEAVSASNRVNFDLFADYNPVTPGEARPARRYFKADAGTAETRPLVSPASKPVQRPNAPAPFAASQSQRNLRPPFPPPPTQRPIPKPVPGSRP